jgi:zinc/manganese transport system substrate-binding protein
MREGFLRAALGLAAFASVAASGQSRPIRVVTLSTVLTEVSREVGGDRALVVGLVRPGVDPHTFSPSPSDIQTLVDADIVLASGMNLEAYMDRLVAGAGLTGRVVAVGDAIPSPLVMPGAAGGERDPHWWHSIGNVLFAVDLVRAELTRARPASAVYFSAHARAYAERLQGLEAWAAVEIGKLPAGRRQLVTSHDAFGYLARDYGFTLHAINGLSTDGEADARHVAALIDLIRRDRIPAVFAESSANPRLVANLVRETGVHLGGTLYADGLGPAGSGAETYDAMYRHNVQAIVGALSAP